MITDVHEIEFRLLLEALHMKYGYDFRGYAHSNMERRIGAVVAKFNMKDVPGLMNRLIAEPEFFRTVLPHLTICTTEMFRDPPFFKKLRQDIMPLLRTYPSLNIWVAGCSYGQEAYSLAILLKEEGLLDRSVIFATDVNPLALKNAREGIFPLENIQIYTRNYIEAGGERAFSNYYTADYGFARMSSDLKDNMVFSEHNLGTDGVFTETHLILCRNVLIYFDKEMQNRVLRLFRESLRHLGYLGLGSKENLRFSNQASAFDVVDEKLKIYQKRMGGS